MSPSEKENLALADLKRYAASPCYRALQHYLEVREINLLRSCATGEAPELYRKQGRAKETESFKRVLAEKGES